MYSMPQEQARKLYSSAIVQCYIALFWLNIMFYTPAHNPASSVTSPFVLLPKHLRQRIGLGGRTKNLRRDKNEGGGSHRDAVMLRLRIPFQLNWLGFPPSTPKRRWRCAK